MFSADLNGDSKVFAYGAAPLSTEPFCYIVIQRFELTCFIAGQILFTTFLNLKVFLTLEKIKKQSTRSSNIANPFL